MKTSDQQVGLKLLLTVPEAARALAVGRSVMYELLLAGRIPSVKIGRSRRIPVSELEHFINGELTNSSPAERSA